MGKKFHIIEWSPRVGVGQRAVVALAAALTKVGAIATVVACLPSRYMLPLHPTFPPTQLLFPCLLLSLFPLSLLCSSRLSVHYNLGTEHSPSLVL